MRSYVLICARFVPPWPSHFIGVINYTRYRSSGNYEDRSVARMSLKLMYLIPDRMYRTSENNSIIESQESIYRGHAGYFPIDKSRIDKNHASHVGSPYEIYTVRVIIPVLITMPSLRGA